MITNITNIFKSKEEKQFIKVEKIIDKYLIKEKKNINFILNNTKFQQYLHNFLNITSFEETISCYNYKIIEIIEKHIEKTEFIEKDKLRKKKLNFVSNTFKNSKNTDIIFLSNKLKKGKFYFQVENTDKEYDIKTTNNIFIDKILEIVNDESADPILISSLFEGLVKNVGKINQEGYVNIFNKLIRHSNMSKKTLSSFLKSQNSISDEKNYINCYKDGSDLELNELKTIIITSKILKKTEVLGLTTLPYISLWKTLINNYFLTNHLLVDFLNQIFTYNKPEEKIQILNFINYELSGRINTIELKEMINTYINNNNT